MKFENIKKSLDGAIYTIFTPFKKNLEIDYIGLEKYLDFLYNSGARVFYAMPYNSRYSQLKEKEIFKLNKFCIQKIDSYDNALVIVSDTIHGPTSLKKELCLSAKENGCKLFASICREKYFNDNQIYMHYEELNKCNIGIIAHVMPFLSGYNSNNFNWPLSIFKKLSKLKNLIGIKEDTKDVNYGKKMIKMFGKRFKIIFAGQKKYFIKLNPDRNFSYLNSSSIIDPRIDKIFLNLLKNDNRKDLVKFVKYIDDYFWNNLCDKYGWHRVNKASIEAIGYFKRYERLPMIHLTAKEQLNLKKKILILQKRLKKIIL